MNKALQFSAALAIGAIAIPAQAQLLGGVTGAVNNTLSGSSSANGSAAGSLVGTGNIVDRPSARRDRWAAALPATPMVQVMRRSLARSMCEAVRPAAMPVSPARSAALLMRSRAPAGSTKPDPLPARLPVAVAPPPKERSVALRPPLPRPAAVLPEQRTLPPLPPVRSLDRLPPRAAPRARARAKPTPAVVRNARYRPVLYAPAEGRATVGEGLHRQPLLAFTDTAEPSFDPNPVNIVRTVRNTISMSSHGEKYLM